MSPSTLIGNIVFGLVKLSINDLKLIDSLVQAMERDPRGEFADKIKGLITVTPSIRLAPPSPTSISDKERAMLEQSIEALEEMLRSIPNDADLLEVLKEAHAKLGRRDEELNVRGRLVKAYEGQGRTSEADLEREALLEMRAKMSPPAKISREEKERLERTVEMYKAITASVPNDYQSLTTLRDTYAKLGRAEDAIRTWRKIVDARLGLGQLTDARTEAEKILAQHPNDTVTLALLTKIRT